MMKVVSWRRWASCFEKAMQYRRHAGLAFSSHHPAGGAPGGLAASSTAHMFWKPGRKSGSLSSDTFSFQ